MSGILFPLLIKEARSCFYCRKMTMICAFIICDQAARRFLLIDAECCRCGHDFGRAFMTPYAATPVSTEVRPLLISYDGTCPKENPDMCFSDTLSFWRGEEIVAAACSDPFCDYYALRPDIQEAYENVVGKDRPLKSLSPFGKKRKL